MSQLMNTKLCPPRVSGEIIARQRLLELFSQNKEAKVVLVTAPAGYGKTVLTMQYINSLQTPSVWYQLDQYDNDPATFIQYLITGIGHISPGFGVESLQLLQQVNLPSSLHLLVIAIVNELSTLAEKKLTLVLDDYHLITAPTVHQFVQELIEHLPAGIQLIITSRTAPALSLSRLQVSGDLTLINIDHLRFTPTEMKDFLAKKQINSSQPLVDSFMAKTAGWPAAIKLLTSVDLKNNLELDKTGSEFIYRYLAEEVIGQLPEDLRQFMTATAVLETLTPEITDLLLERNDSRQILSEIESQQLFLIPLTGQDQTYRYHHLFQDFLLEQLGTERTRFFKKAGTIAFEKGDFEQAVEYFLKSGVDQEQIPFIEKAGREAFRVGRWQTVERWLSLRSPEQIERHEWLCLFQAKTAIYRGKLEEAVVWLHKSMDGLNKRHDQVGIAECQFLQAKIFNRQGQYQDSLNLLAKAYPVLQKAEPSLRFDLPLEEALIYIRMGKLVQAEDVLLKGLQVSEKEGDAWIKAHFLEGLGNTYYMLGETQKALDYYEKAARLSPNGILPGYCADFTGFLYQELGDMERAFTYLHNSITQKEALGLNEPLLPAYFQLSGLYADINELEKAEEVYNKASRLISEIGGERFFTILLKVNLSRIRSQQGQLPEAQIIMEQILNETQSESGVALTMCRLFYGAIFLMSGNFAEAEKVLIEVLKSRIEFAQALTQCYFLMASVKFLRGDLLNTAKYSRKLLEYSARKNFEQIYIYIFDDLQPVLQFGLEYNVEVPFIQRVLVLLGERSIKLLTELSSHRNSSVRSRIVFPLSQINTESATQLLQKLGSDFDPKIRRLVEECTDEKGLLKKESRSSLMLIINPNPKKQTPPKEVSFFPVSSIQAKAAPLQIGMLGPLRIIYNQTDITRIRWRFTKSRDLLLYLAHQGKPVGINQILEDLWPEFPLEKGLNFFYNSLHRLRQIIHNDSKLDIVTYAAKTCQLLPAEYTTDQQQFFASITKCSSESFISLNNVALFEETVALYRGEYLSQLDYPWVLSEREHLRRLYLEISIRLAKFYLEIHEFLKATKLLEPLTAQNPLREEIFGLLMTAYAGLGDRLAVIRQYQQLKLNLNEELGIEPAPEITKLYYQLCGSNERTRNRLKKA